MTIELLFSCCEVKWKGIRFHFLYAAATLTLHTVVQLYIQYCTMLCCAVLYCTIYCTILYCVVLYHIIYCRILYHTVLYHIRNILYNTVPYCTVLYNILYNTVLYS